MTAKETMTPIARTASAADREYPWHVFIKNVLKGTNYFRGSEYLRLMNDIKEWVDEVAALQRELAELKATNAGMAKDAARYRWLRERHRNPYIQLNVPPYGTGIISGTECDEVIDAALATSAGERKGEG
jgi:hypothetical protein